jgi:hypothetical protein
MIDECLNTPVLTEKIVDFHFFFRFSFLSFHPPFTFCYSILLSGLCSFFHYFRDLNALYVVEFFKLFRILKMQLCLIYKIMSTTIVLHFLSRDVFTFKKIILLLKKMLFRNLGFKIFAGCFTEKHFPEKREQNYDSLSLFLYPLFSGQSKLRISERFRKESKFSK